MIKTLVILLAGFLPVLAQAQASVPDTPREQAALVPAHGQGIFAKNDLNLLLRSSLEVPDGSSNQGGIRLNEARMELLGELTPALSYRFRYRLNRSYAPNTQDNAPGALDWAAASYKFGRDRRWKITVGKQSAAVGSWEFEKNPTFEYQYSELVNRQLNIFLTAALLSYDVNKDHRLLLQVHNTSNNSFSNTLATTGYVANGLQPAKLPLGVYAAWMGNFADQKIRTFYSYNISQFAEGRRNHAVAVGNKVVLPRFQAYLDLAWSHIGVEYFNIASPAVNNYFAAGSTLPYTPVFAQDLSYKNAVLRLDYEFVPRWFVTAKGFWEGVSYRGNDSRNVLGSNFRQNIGLLGGLEYQPVKSQGMKFFSYYYHNRVRHNAVALPANPSTTKNLFAVGMLYFLNAF